MLASTSVRAEKGLRPDMAKAMATEGIVVTVIFVARSDEGNFRVTIVERLMLAVIMRLLR